MISAEDGLQPGRLARIGQSESGPARTVTTVSTDASVPLNHPSIFDVAQCYHTGKDMHEYAKSFRVVTPFASLAESSIAYALKKVGMDAQVYRFLETLDEEK